MAEHVYVDVEVPYGLPEFAQRRSAMVRMEAISSFGEHYIQLNQGDPNFLRLNAMLANLSFRSVIPQYVQRGSVMVRMDVISSFGEHFILLNQGDPNFVRLNAVLVNIPFQFLTLFERFVDLAPEPSGS